MDGIFWIDLWENGILLFFVDIVLLVGFLVLFLLVLRKGLLLSVLCIFWVKLRDESCKRWIVCCRWGDRVCC